MQSKLTVEVIDTNERPGMVADVKWIWGGLDPPPNWQEYLDDVEPFLRPHLAAARIWLVATYGDSPPRASAWCNDRVLRFSDGVCLGFSWRAWGDFVQAVRDRREGYMAFYA